MNERNTGVHNLISAIRSATKERPLGVHIASVVDVAPIKLEANDLEIELDGSDAIINPDLLERVEYGQITIEGGTTQNMTLTLDSRINVGDEVLVISNTDTADFYVVAKMTGGG